MHIKISLLFIYTQDNNLYIWGLYDKHNYRISYIKTPLLVRTNINKPYIFDYISLGYDKFYAIVRIFENGNYIKKIFTLEVCDSNSIILKEVKIFNKKEDNSRIIPIKLLIGKNKVYVLSVNENNLLKEINENKIPEKGQISMNVCIEKKENDKYTEELNSIFSSEYINNFMKIFNSFSDENIVIITNILDDINKSEKISIDNISYELFINSLKQIKGIDELILFFKENKNNEGKVIFQFLKRRISLIAKYFKQFNNSNLLSEECVQNKILLNNILYLTDNERIEYFNKKLLKTIENIYNNPKYLTIDRFKANSFYDKYNENSEKIPDIELNQTIFGQLFHAYEDVQGEKFRIRKNERFFRVELEGEGAIDAGGPYHEIISLMCNELQSDYIDLFIKTPNNNNNLGELRDKFIANPNANKAIHKKAYEFLGKFMGMAIYSGEALSLDFHSIIWKSILENKIEFGEYKTIDLLFFNLINQLEDGLKNKDENLINKFDLNFIIQNLNNSDIDYKWKI